MLVIRREVTRTKSYTVMICGDYVKRIPTSQHEHAEIMKIYKQDKPYEGIVNDFTDYGIEFDSKTK